MGADLYFSHGLLFVHDADEKEPGNDWSEDHTRQGFARRPSSVNIAMLLDDGTVDLVAPTVERLAQSERVIAVSLFAASGRIYVSGLDPEVKQIWEDPPGWVRLVLAQRRIADDRVEMSIRATPAEKDEPTDVQPNPSITRAFVETSRVARF